MGIHLLSGELALGPIDGAHELRGEEEVRFAVPVRQVAAMLSGFSVVPASEPHVPMTGLRISLGATQQQIPSKVAQIHGTLSWRGSPPPSRPLAGKIAYTVLGIE